MNVVIAMDSFKGSLGSFEAGQAVREGLLRVYPEADCKIVPIADGGEGTVDALVQTTGGVQKETVACDPLGRKIKCAYGILGDGRRAVIEMSAAAGITLIEAQERNPLYTTTYGVGEMILHAIREGCRHFIVGIGGSATNDGGAGMLQALGFDLLDQRGEPIAPGAVGLRDLCTVTVENVAKELWECTFSVACDVKNPLCGENGCSAVFGPQKGADSTMIADMDSWLLQYSEKMKECFPAADRLAPGAGAAGGLGFAFMALGATLTSGIDLILKEADIEKSIRDADVVVVGEGRLDAQTVMGKAPFGVARIAKKCNKAVLGFAGAVTKDATLCNERGIDAFFPILRRICTLEEALTPTVAYDNMADTVEQAFRLWKTKGNLTRR